MAKSKLRRSESPSTRVEGVVHQHLKKEDSEKVASLVSHPGFDVLVGALSRAIVICGESALDDGRAEYWSGVREGINLFFECVGAEARSVDFSKRMSPLEVELRKEEEDESTPQFVLGGSSL